MLGRPVEVTYRPDGRPEVPGTGTLSAAHGGGLTLCVAGAGPLGCDVEPVEARPAEVWDGLLGGHADLARLVAAETGEDVNTAATRVWTALECLQKAGRQVTDPLALQPSPRPGWSIFASGGVTVATFVTTVRDRPAPLVFAVLAGGQ
jgi:enediyne polyketide synthase